MAGPENLLARWSRRKNDARTRERDAGNAPHDSEACATPVGAQPGDVLPPFDPASLPTLDSISAETDLRAFLGKGVPSELARAALRRGWSADPTIRDFIGLSENSWDFNAPGGIPGFGTLEPGDIQRLLARFTGGNEMSEGVAPTSAAPLPSERATPQPAECAASSELRQDMTDNDVDSHSTQNAPQDPTPAQIVPVHSVDVAKSKVQLAREPDVRAPSGRHSHGAARPRFDVI